MKYYEPVSGALVTQHAIRMRHVILLSMASLAVPYYLLNSTIFGETLLSTNVCFDFYTNFV
jgi:hypothetical protein